MTLGSAGPWPHRQRLVALSRDLIVSRAGSVDRSAACSEPQRLASPHGSTVPNSEYKEPPEDEVVVSKPILTPRG
jgi:hypothetical protein